MNGMSERVPDLLAPRDGFSPLASERDLAGVAHALADPQSVPTDAERLIAASDFSAASLVPLRASIKSGGDPLGHALCALRSPVDRRRDGAIYTPQPIVDAMVAWAAANGTPARIVDPGAGSGRYLLAAASAFPKAELVAVEIDPLAALLLRANAAALDVSDRLTVVVGDYRDLELPHIAAPTLFLGNPPYVRHHDINPSWKAWLADAAAALGYRASKLAGLHVHFLLKTSQLARVGDYGAFITSAEWLDVNYGDLVRRLVLRDLGGLSVHAIAASAKPFSDATTTGAILCFRVGQRDPIRLRRVASVDELGDLREGKALSGGEPVARSCLERTRRWSPFLCPAERKPANFVELGELCRVHRGQVTGCNRAWIAGAYAGALPESVLTPAVTKARELFAAAPVLSNTESLRRVVDLPVNLETLGAYERRQVDRFLAWARAVGAQKSYVANNRRAWWAVGLKSPAPILCTYMARRPPAFVRNPCGARHLNIAHGLYPREHLKARLLDALSLWLQHNVEVGAGRTYAGGLTKFEPKEVERILIPPLEELYERTEALDVGGTGSGCGTVAGCVSTATAGRATGSLL